MLVAEIGIMRFSIQPGGSPAGRDLRLKFTDVPKLLDIITTPTPASLPPTTAPGSPFLCADLESIQENRPGGDLNGGEGVQLTQLGRFC